MRLDHRTEILVDGAESAAESVAGEPDEIANCESVIAERYTQLGKYAGLSDVGLAVLLTDALPLQDLYLLIRYLLSLTVNAAAAGAATAVAFVCDAFVGARVEDVELRRTFVWAVVSPSYERHDTIAPRSLDIYDHKISFRLDADLHE